MKNLLRLPLSKTISFYPAISLFYFVLIMPFLFSCEKKSDLASISGATSKFEVALHDGRLNFKSPDDYKAALDFVMHSSTEKIIEWEKSIGFKSSFDWYLEAKNEYCCGRQANDLNFISKKYLSLIIITEDGDIEPLNSTIGLVSFLLNDVGEVSVGNSLLKFSKGNLICIPDGDINKLQEAIISQKSNESEGIYVHSLSSANETLRSACTGHLTKTVSVTSPDDYRLISSLDLVNISFVSYPPPQNLAVYTIIYNLNTNIKHQRKGFLGVWGCVRRAITWSRTYTLYNNYSTYGYSIPNPLTGNQGLTSDSECDYNYSTQLIYIGFASYSAFNSGGFTNLDYMSQTASVTGPYIYNSMSCD